MSDDFEMINEALRVAVDDGTVLGVAAMGATSDALAYEGFFGKANAHAGTPMARDTVFWLLSMTKTFTAVAGMQLIEQGKLDPEQSAADVLPQLASPRVWTGQRAGCSDSSTGQAADHGAASPHPYLGIHVPHLERDADAI